MSDNLNPNDKLVLLVGAGFMAREYLIVLKALKCRVKIIGRGSARIQKLKTEFNDFDFYSGGIKKFLKTEKKVPSFAINAVSISQLENVTHSLINFGVKNILVEKPGSLTREGLLKINNSALKKGINVGIAYNRRFLSSIAKLKKEIKIDGGVSSVHFEFTEWIHTIDPSIYDKESLTKWILSNSSHVIDTVFSLIGKPKILDTHITGQNKIEWHPSGSIFTGAGISTKNIPFTYHSNWESAGRWSIEISTTKRRFFLKPMEKIFQQSKGSILNSEIKIEDQLDKNFKPGLFLLTESFLHFDMKNILKVNEQLSFLSFYSAIGGYK